MSKIVSLIGLLLVTGLNFVVVFFASLLAAGGDGSSSGIYEVRFVAGLFVTGFFLIGLHRWHGGRPSIGISAMALPIAWVIGLVFLIAAQLFGFHAG